VHKQSVPRKLTQEFLLVDLANKLKTPCGRSAGIDREYKEESKGND